MVKIICFVIVVLISINNFSKSEILLDSENKIDNSKKFSEKEDPKAIFEKEEKSDLEILKIKEGGFVIEKKVVSPTYKILRNERVDAFFYKDTNYKAKKIIVFDKSIEYKNYIINNKNEFSYKSKEIKNSVNINFNNLMKKLIFLNYINDEVPYIRIFYDEFPGFLAEIEYSDYIVLTMGDLSYILDLAEREEIMKYNLKETDLKEINELIEYVYNNQEVKFDDLDRNIQERLKNVDTYSVEKLIEKEIINIFDLLEEKEKMGKVIECKGSNGCKELKK